MNTYNRSTREAEAGGSQVSLDYIVSETLDQQSNNKESSMQWKIVTWLRARSSNLTSPGCFDLSYFNYIKKIISLQIFYLQKWSYLPRALKLDLITSSLSESGRSGAYHPHISPLVGSEDSSLFPCVYALFSEIQLISILSVDWHYSEVLLCHLKSWHIRTFISDMSWGQQQLCGDQPC